MNEPLFESEAEELDYKFEVWLEQTLHTLHAEYIGKFRYLGEGGTRAVFQINETHVVKLPTNEKGLDGNLREAAIYARKGRNGDIPYAACEVFHVNDIPLLKMELVNPRLPKGSRPPWADFVDCGQVGVALDGQIVAYDFGD